ncbi:MAG: peptidoglycan D,D-transpeptidase FtsI family protein [Pontiellaceae bacterium]
MKVRQPQRSSHLVIGALLIIILSGFTFLGAELWQLQVREQDGFETLFRNQSLRRVRLPAVRGKIYDAKDRVLADSIPNYCIAIYTHELRAPRSGVANVLEQMHEIWSRVGRPPNVSYAQIKTHMLEQPEKPLTVYSYLTDDEILRWRTEFEKWTAPKRGSFRRQKIAGLDLGRPIQGRAIVLETHSLARRRTSTAANTLELVYRISDRLNKPRAVRYQQIKDHIFARRPLPLIAWTHLNKADLARWADRCSTLPGTDIICLPARTYPGKTHTAHIIGYTLQADTDKSPSQAGRVHYDLRGLKGCKGLEYIYNPLLTGTYGYQLLQIDAAGFHNHILQTTQPKAGGDLKLTIDAEIQRMATEALANKQTGEYTGPVKGAAVVLDATNGDVLALVSSPSFDPNRYMESSIYRQQLLTDAEARTFQRAVFGQYPPGSTFKTITALSALKENPFIYQQKHTCAIGYRNSSGRPMRCWIHSQGGSHGSIDLKEAIMKSCNIYFYEIAQEMGYASIYKTAQAFGIGQYAGLFPDLEAPQEHRDIRYGNLPETAANPTDLCNLSIGQGQLLTSPLQMAMVATAIANGGTLYRPRLVKQFRTQPDLTYQENPTWAIRRIDVDIESLEKVRQGMRDVVMDRNGTARAAQVEGISIAGKTGSAQYRKKVGDQVEDRVHAWMISYAPYDSPRYAIAMLVEEGVSGGQTIGPRLSQLYRMLFEYDGTLSGEQG